MDGGYVFVCCGDEIEYPNKRTSVRYIMILDFRCWYICVLTRWCIFGQTVMAKKRYMHISLLGIYRDVLFLMMVHTVDGKHPAPVDSLYNYVQGLYVYIYIYTSLWLGHIGNLNDPYCKSPTERDNRKRDYSMVWATTLRLHPPRKSAGGKVFRESTYPTKGVLAGKSSTQKCRLIGDVLVAG